MTVLLLCIGQRPCAQSLAEAARRAEEARKAAGDAGPIISNKDLPGGRGYAALVNEYVIDTDALIGYFEATEAILTLRARDRDVDTYLFKWESQAESVFDLESPYAADKAIMSILYVSGRRISPHTYFMTQLAFNRALEDAKLPPAVQKALTMARRRNIVEVQARLRGGDYFGSIRRLTKELDQARLSRAPR
jgi:hypothetical protein